MLTFIRLTIAHYILYVPGHGSMHLIGLDKMSTHVMSFEPMIKVLSTYILTDQLVNPRLTMSHPVIPNLNAQLVNHRLHHALNARLLEGLVVDQNRVDLGGVSPKTTIGKNVTLKFYLNYKLEATRNFNLM